MAHPHESTRRLSLPNSKRQYVPPLLLARGRGRKLNELQSSKSLIGGKPCIGNGSKLLKKKEGSVIHSKDRHKTVHPCATDDDDDACLDPLFAPTRRVDEMPINYHDSSSESFNGDGIADNETHSSSEDHDMNSDDDGNHVDNDHEVGNANDSIYDDANDNANDNVLVISPSTQQNVNADSSTKKKTDNEKRRGRNKCKEIAKLKPGEKLDLTFYNNRAVGKNHKVFARHLGIIVRDTNICPVRVHKWNDIEENVKNHMWSAVTDVFSNENMESYREHVFDHMKELWTNWRSDLLRYNVTNKKITLRAALKNKPPNGLDKNEWQWLIKEIYSNPEFQKKSARNSQNRANYKTALSHRTGSKPFRQLMWDDLGASKGIKPKLVDVFHLTRKKGDSLPNEETTQKYNEIRETMEKDPSLSNVEVAQKVFNSKSRDRVVCLGGGMKLKDVKRPQPSRQELEVELNATKKQNQVLTSHVEEIQEENKQLKDRMGSVETQMKALHDMLAQQFNISLPSSNELNSQGT